MTRLFSSRVTLASRGAKTPGIDDIDNQAMECDLQYQLDTIRSELLAGGYQPQPSVHHAVRAGHPTIDAPDGENIRMNHMNA